MPPHTPAMDAPARPAEKKPSRVAKYTVKRLLKASFTLPRLQGKGFTHPENGHFVMVPLEFSDLLALETKPVAQVLLAIMRCTIGVPGKGPHDRGLWVQLSVRDIATIGRMLPGMVQRGLKIALEKGYLKRRPISGKRWEYSIHWRGIKN